jgi:hypothetical protein
MFNSVAGAQGIVQVALGLVALGMQVFALVDALRQRTDAFAAAGKLTKKLWLVILGVATALGFVSLYSPLNFFNLIAVVAAGVYLADVRPALRGVTGGGTGPYGPW